MYSLGISLRRLPGQTVRMTRFEMWTSVARNWRTNHAKLTLRHKLNAAAMERTRTVHEGGINKYINYGAESSMKAATFSVKNGRKCNVEES
jgi:hypothetical protein